jgi:hypothetical protein
MDRKLGHERSRNFCRPKIARGIAATQRYGCGPLHLHRPGLEALKLLCKRGMRRFLRDRPVSIEVGLMTTMHERGRPRGPADLALHGEAGSRPAIVPLRQSSRTSIAALGWVQRGSRGLLLLRGAFGEGCALHTRMRAVRGAILGLFLLTWRTPSAGSFEAPLQKGTIEWGMLAGYGLSNAIGPLRPGSTSSP